MLKRYAAVMTAFSLLALVPAQADWTANVVGGSATFGSFDVGGIKYPKHVMVDPTTGAAIGVAANPMVVSVTNLPAAGQKTMANSLPTVPASDYVPPLATNAATAAAQATGNTSLASIAAANGAPTDAAWDGAASSAAQVGILKSVWNKLSGLLTVDTVVRSTSTDCGGALTTASTAVTLCPAKADARGLIVQNRNAPATSYNAATSVFVNCLTTATGSFHDLEVPAGALYETPAHHAGTGACSFYSQTANTNVYARRF